MENNRTVTEKMLRSYRFTSGEDPTDEMLCALMEKVAESARASSARAEAALRRMFDETASRIAAKREQGI